MEEFRTERWRVMDADVRFTGKRIVHSDKLPFNDLEAHLVLDDGTLSLEPLRFGMAGGTLESTVRLEGGRVPCKAAPASVRGTSSSSSCSPPSSRCAPASAS